MCEITLGVSTALLNIPVGELKAAVAAHCGHPPEVVGSFGLALGLAALQDVVPLRTGDVQDSNFITLFPTPIGPREIIRTKTARL